MTRPGRLASVILVVGAVYCLLPVAWVVIAATKSSSELFSTSTLVPGGALVDNIARLGAYRDGLFWQWRPTPRCTPESAGRSPRHCPA